MEENKINKEEVKVETQKLTYEQLEQIASQLSQQVQSLYTELQKANTTNLIRRLEMLFKVVENGKAFNSEFVETCTKEIEALITIPNDNEEGEGA